MLKFLKPPGKLRWFQLCLESEDFLLKKIINEHDTEMCLTQAPLTVTRYISYNLFNINEERRNYKKLRTKTS